MSLDNTWEITVEDIETVLAAHLHHSTMPDNEDILEILNRLPRESMISKILCCTDFDKQRAVCYSLIEDFLLLDRMFWGEKLFN